MLFRCAGSRGRWAGGTQWPEASSQQRPKHFRFYPKDRKGSFKVSGGCDMTLFRKLALGSVDWWAQQGGGRPSGGWRGNPDQVMPGVERARAGF